VIGVLYLENNLAPRVFTPARSAVLKVLASQAAIALENAYLYTDLQQENSERRRAEDALRRSEVYLAEAQSLSHTGSFGWNPSRIEIYWSAETYRIFEFDGASPPSLRQALERTHPEDRAYLEGALDQARQEKQDFDLEYRLLMSDGSIKHLQVVARAQVGESGDLEFVGAIMDVTQRRRAEQAQREAQSDLMHITRVTTMDELAASIAHEVNQPLTSIVTSAETCLAWLDKEPPNLDRVRKGTERIIRDGLHAGDVIRSLRALVRKTTPEIRSLDLHDVMQEVLELLRGELNRHGATLETSFLKGLPRVLADRVQLQQVIVNLVTNGIQAMSAVTGRPRVLRVSTQLDPDEMVRIAVADVGIGLDPDQMSRIFEPMFTTKREGLGMGLPICRTIVEAHGGRLWASANPAGGAVFQFTLPVAPSSVLEV
jgi:C4-dicarboxylate-specific signal transduction histidine kinase